MTAEHTAAHQVNKGPAPAQTEQPQPGLDNETTPITSAAGSCSSFRTETWGINDRS
jgi:hypothetical protein